MRCINCGEQTKESILYGVRLDDYEIDGVEMLALIGISDISSIQDNMVIDSFIKDGYSRGNSSLIDEEGNYIINVNKEIYLNKQNNLYDHLSEASDSELTNEVLTLSVRTAPEIQTASRAPVLA